MRLVGSMSAEVGHIGCNAFLEKRPGHDMHPCAAVRSAMNEHRNPLRTCADRGGAIASIRQGNAVARLVVFDHRQIAVVDGAELMTESWGYSQRPGLSKHQKCRH